MVRKRSRKYANDDNESDSDVDFDAETHLRPAPKKYSLRERKSTNFLLDNNFDVFLEDEDRYSSDEEFKVEESFDGARPFFEPDPNTVPQNSEGLIDFEDIIRADIVINKNKIDYDNLIQKSEIKLNQPKRRGRKPKNRVEAEAKQENECNNVVCEPELENLTEIHDEKEEESMQDGTVDETPTTVGSEEKTNTKAEESTIEKVEESTSIKNEENCNKSATNAEPPELETLSSITENVEDDDVIVLGEPKQDVIVLDD